jgi:hypothetical protein
MLRVQFYSLGVIGDGFVILAHSIIGEPPAIVGFIIQGIAGPNKKKY